jgi:hypothetical protein
MRFCDQCLVAGVFDPLLKWIALGVVLTASNEERESKGEDEPGQGMSFFHVIFSPVIRCAGR